MILSSPFVSLVSLIDLDHDEDNRKINFLCMSRNNGSHILIQQKHYQLSMKQLRYAYRQNFKSYKIFNKVIRKTKTKNIK